MKKLSLDLKLLLVLFYLCCFSVYGQIKVLSGGRVGIGTNEVSSSKLHVFWEQYTMPLLLTTNAEGYGYTSAARSQNDFVKNWVVVRRLLGTSNWGAENFLVYSSGDVYGAHYFTSSDQRIKRNFTQISKPLDKLNLINGYYYNNKSISEIDSSLRFGNDNVNKRRMGFIAQEIAQILPEVVDTNSNGLICIAYQEILPLLVEAIKSQQKQINYLNDVVLKNSSSNNEILYNQSNQNDFSRSTEVKLYQNSPNPFVGMTKVNFETTSNSKKIAIFIFDFNGKLLRKYENLNSGKQSIEIRAEELKAGLYFYSLIIDGVEIDTKKLIIE